MPTVDAGPSFGSRTKRQAFVITAPGPILADRCGPDAAIRVVNLRTTATDPEAEHRGIATLNGTTVLRQPDSATETQRQEFARLVRRGFKTAGVGLGSRVAAANCLAFHYSRVDELVAIAALKSPDDQYRRDVFNAAGSRQDFTDYKFELGWVYVEPAYRGRGLATLLCKRLFSDIPVVAAFATTRTDNAVMSRVLGSCGFDKAGRPYVRRGERLELYLRPR